jgi:hypothetical protein
MMEKDDCENGEDEGVDPETLDLEWNIPNSITYNWKYEMVGDDVIFMGVLSLEYSDWRGYSKLLYS